MVYGYFKRKIEMKKTTTSRAASAALAIALGLCQNPMITTGVLAADAPAASENGEQAFSAVRTDQAVSGKDYVLAGGNASQQKIMTSNLISAPKAGSVFAQADAAGLDTGNTANALSVSEDWIWTLQINEQGQAALYSKTKQKYLSFQEGARPASLSDAPVWFTFENASHHKAGKSFSFRLGTWYLNFSDTQGGFSAYNGTTYNQDKSTPVNQFALYEVSQSQQPEEPDDPIEADALSTVLFLSDFQTGNEVAPYQSAADVPEALRSVIRGIGQKMVHAGFQEIDSALLCGDYSAFNGQYNYDASPVYGLEALSAELQALWPQLASIIKIQGNHDLTNYPYDSGPVEFDNYVVYAINTMYNSAQEGSFPWYQQASASNKAAVQRLADRLEAYLAGMRQNNDHRPVIIMCHVPLHFSGRSSSLYGSGDNMNAGLVFDVINEAAKDQDIVFLFGHNHSNGWDNYLGGSAVFRQPGETILIPDADRRSGNTTNYYRAEKLNFTYMNAGYVGYYKDATSDGTLTASICQIFEDKMVFRRYDSNGLHVLGAAGAYNSKYNDQSILAGYEILKDDKPSPVTVDRLGDTPGLRIEDTKAAAGSSVTIKASAHNLESPVIEFAISDPDAFEVLSQKDGTLTLFCKKAGTYTITASAAAGEQTLSESCQLTVEPGTGQAVLTLADANGNASSVLDPAESLQLSLNAAGIREISSISWSAPDFVCFENESESSRSVSFASEGNGTIRVLAEVLDADGNTQTLNAFYELSVRRLPEFARSVLPEGKTDVLFVHNTGNALSSQLYSTGGIACLRPQSFEGADLSAENDTFKADLADLIWTMTPASNGKWTIMHKASGKYLSLSEGSRSVSLSDAPVEFEIETASWSNGPGQAIAIHNGEMYLNYSKSKAGFCGYAGEDISNANNQYLLYTLQQEEEPVQQADKRLLEMAVAYAEGIDAESLASLNAVVRKEFTERLAKAREVLASETAKQQEVDEAWSNLARAIHLLGFTSDKSVLNALIEEAAKVDVNAIAEGREEFEAALAFAQQVAADPAALNGASIEQAIDRLQAAMDAIVISGDIDTSLLELLVQTGEGIDLSLYIESGKAEWTEALAQAKAVLASPASQAAVDAAASRLHQAWLNLRLAPSEEMLEELKNFAAQLNALDLSSFEAAAARTIEDYRSRLGQALAHPETLDLSKALDLLDEKADIEALLAQKPADARPQSAASVKTAAALHAEGPLLLAGAAAALAAVLRRRARR